MLRKITTRQTQGFLANYRLPELGFSPHGKLSERVHAIWDALNTGNPGLARTRAEHALEEKRLCSASERAALKVGLAAAELFSGATDRARRQAGRSLDLFPGQWSAHRILLTLLTMQRAFKAAYMHLSSLEIAHPVPAWDEPLRKSDQLLVLASWSWRLGEWETVAEHLNEAFPKGLSTMPTEVLEDWFRLSLYRNRPDDAAAAAAILIKERPAELADELLQTIVQSGWTKEALPLYRNAFSREPQSELLRRRLVALSPGALSLAA